MVVVPGPTVVAYELNGKAISADEVSAGIADGSLKWANGVPAPAAQVTSAAAPSVPAASAPAPSSEAPAPSSSAAPAPSSSAAPDAGAQFYQKPESSSTSGPASSSTSAAATSASKPASTGSSSSDSSYSSSAKGVDKEFPSGELDCGTFPSDYGAISVDWLKLDSWIGIQFVSGSGDLIRNAVEEEKCVEGTMCSYACPAGYQKSQWPTTQGSTGQSIGGLSCSGGKLHLTNPAFKTLCIKGTGKVKVQNKLGSNVAVCRTDYPGKSTCRSSYQTLTLTPPRYRVRDGSSRYGRW